jgi:hypothetical protein
MRTVFKAIYNTQNQKKSTGMSDRKLFIPFKNFGSLYSRVPLGAAPEPTKQYPIFRPEPEPHKNDAGPQHL